MTYESLYNGMKDYFEQRDYTGLGQGVYSYQFIVSGEGSGIFYLEVRDGVPKVQPFDYKNCRCSLTLDSGILQQIVEQKLSPVEAYLTGRLTVHGDVPSAFLLADTLGISV